MRTFKEFMMVVEELKPLPIEKMHVKVERLSKQATSKLTGKKPDIFGASKLTDRVGNISRSALGKPNPKVSVTRVKGRGAGGAFGSPLVKPIETGETSVVKQSRQKAQQIYGGRGV